MNFHLLGISLGRFLLQATHSTIKLPRASFEEPVAMMRVVRVLLVDRERGISKVTTGQEQPEQPVTLSAYELQRLANIERNNEVLRDLGLSQETLGLIPVPAKQLRTKKAARDKGSDYEPSDSSSEDSDGSLSENASEDSEEYIPPPKKRAALPAAFTTEASPVPPVKRPRLEAQQTHSAACKHTSRLTQSELDSELRACALRHIATRLAHNDPLAHASLAFCMSSLAFGYPSMVSLMPCLFYQ
jgi:hypothetical protein